MEFKLKSFKQDISVSRIANIHYFEFTKEYHTFEDRHPFRELVYTDSGSVNVRSEGYSGILEENHAIIHKTNEIHSLTCSSGTAPNVIIIGFECSCRELDVFSETPYAMTPYRQQLLADIIKEGRNVFFPPYDVPNTKNMQKRKHFPFGADQMIRIKLEALFIDMIRGVRNMSEEMPNGSAIGCMPEIGTYIENNFRENITLGDLCFLFGMNKTTLCGEFKAAYGDTIINYINKKRIKEAKRIMREGGFNLTQTAALSGFSSIHYFSRAFRKYEGKSPSEYIKTVKSKLMI